MRIILAILYFLIIFLPLAIIVMFVAGVVGTAGTFYLMVLVENIQQNVTLVVLIMLLLLFITLVLRRKNKQAIKRKAILKTERKTEQQNGQFNNVSQIKG